MTLAVLIGAAILLNAGYLWRRRRLDALAFRAGRIRLAQGQTPVPGQRHASDQF